MRSTRLVARTLACAAATIALSACGAAGAGTAPMTALPLGAPARGSSLFERVHPAASGKIQHVVIVVQENRSFDNLFQGYPGADTQSYGYKSNGDKVRLKPIGLETSWDIDHSSGSFFAACDGHGSIPGTNCKMDGFDKEWCGPGCPRPDPQYGYVPRRESKPYFAMANQYVLADRMFTSNFDASSFISHQYIIAGQASSAVDYPATTWGCDGGPSDQIGTVDQQRQYSSNIRVCFEHQTLGDELDVAHHSWRFYTAALQGDGNIWSAYQAIKHIRYGPDWRTNIIHPQTRFFGDVKSGSLPDVSWVTPTCGNSDHAGCGSNTGPQWVTALVNAVGTSKYWNSTAIFVMWDDYGGWYDHVPPAYLDYDGVGIRVPLLIISPYAKKNHVSHVHYEHGSILRFVEDQFGLPRLAQSDQRANSPEGDSFDFTKAPRPFVPFQSRLTEADFERAPLDNRMPDNK